MNHDKHFLASKINVTAILIAAIDLAALGDTLPPQLSRLAPWFTLTGAVATVIFRTFYTTKGIRVRRSRERR